MNAAVTPPPDKPPQSEREAVANPGANQHAAIVDNEDLLARRDRLKMRSEQLRSKLALHSSRVRPAFSASDRAMEGLDWLKAHPRAVAIVGGGVLGLLAARPRALLQLGTSAFALWQTAQRVMPMVRAVTRRF